ncbi:LANO_0E16116g1_1 [Lachancea nothofagi CBS 11611]|uniref:LANO_0E16116g1_1 n=1 Tax=Lachancea nothofagi CBS 11611 TaxID=1266666 RepID=A0A1G4K1M6_9SACH|nr:LANO_0E16116g1_1 [Lachancea nothofagi CBS 11611]
MPSIAQEAIPFILSHYDSYATETKTNPKSNSPPLVIYVSGPQGSGKTYSSKAIKELLKSARPKLETIVVSIDDFYLTHDDQCQLARTFADNTMLQGRGLPGTHDMQLLANFMHGVQRNEGSLHIPTYDKSRFGGEGDRVNSLREVSLPVDLVIIEGWFLGFESTSEEKIAAMRSEKNTRRGEILRTHSLQNFIQINNSFHQYAQTLWDNSRSPSLGVVISADVQNIYEWRQEQETHLISESGHGMSNEQVKAFVLRYMPCYEIYYPLLKTGGNFGTRGTLIVSIDKERDVVGLREKQGA